MQVATSPKEILSLLKPSRGTGQTIGLVPTMGALHQGHLSLVAQSQLDNEVTVVSVFVNPLQFNNSEDLARYPRPFDQDLSLLRTQGVDFVYAPTVEAMYAHKPETQIGFGRMAQVLEGEFRPGHFDGVGLVVAKLFHQVLPNRAYFGQKDLQQYILIKRMVEDLSFPTQVVRMPIVRELSGLAMSSRNQRLSDKGKDVAQHIYTGLKLAEERFSSLFSIDETKSAVSAFYKEINGLDVEYLEIVDAENLMPVSHPETTANIVMCVAVYVEGIRLIDNLYLRLD